MQGDAVRLGTTKSQYEAFAKGIGFEGETGEALRALLQIPSIAATRMDHVKELQTNYASTSYFATAFEVLMYLKSGYSNVSSAVVRPDRIFLYRDNATSRAKASVEITELILHDGTRYVVLGKASSPD
jgi:hypothetical protein